MSDVSRETISLAIGRVLGPDFFQTAPGYIFEENDGITIERYSEFVAIIRERGEEVARYQWGVVHEAIAIFKFGPLADRILADNGGAPILTHWACGGECAPYLCEGRLHVHETYPGLRPMAIFHRQFISQPWREISTSAHNWPYVMFGFMFPLEERS